MPSRSQPSCPSIMYTDMDSVLRYADVSNTSSGTSSDLVNVFTGGQHSSLDFPRLHRDARSGFYRVRGDEYPVENSIANIELTRPFEFAHSVQLIRARIWKARTELGTNSNMQLHPSFTEKLLSSQLYVLFMKELVGLREVSRGINSYKHMSTDFEVILDLQWFLPVQLQRCD
jgi:hypothetical protein